MDRRRQRNCATGPLVWRPSVGPGRQGAPREYLTSRQAKCGGRSPRSCMRRRLIADRWRLETSSALGDGQRVVRRSSPASRSMSSLSAAGSASERSAARGTHCISWPRRGCGSPSSSHVKKCSCTARSG